MAGKWKRGGFECNGLITTSVRNRDRILSTRCADRSVERATAAIGNISTAMGNIGVP
jgi:hypothetical protein